jgi:general stress protein YciG
MTGKSKRGFASMDPSRQREIASRGGRAAHAKGTAHEWSPDEARVAGRKGGEVVSRDRDHMAAIGREGGEARGRNSARLKGRQRGALPEGVSDRESAMYVSREGMPNATGSRPSQPAAYEEEEARS